MTIRGELIDTLFHRLSLSDPEASQPSARKSTNKIARGGTTLAVSIAAALAMSGTASAYTLQNQGTVGSISAVPHIEGVYYTGRQPFVTIPRMSAATTPGFTSGKQRITEGYQVNYWNGSHWVNYYSNIIGTAVVGPNTTVNFTYDNVWVNPYTDYRVAVEISWANANTGQTIGIRGIIWDSQGDYTCSLDENTRCVTGNFIDLY